MLGLNQTLANSPYDYNFAYGNKDDGVEVYNNRGIAYIKKGKLEQAIVSFSKAIELDPDYVRTAFEAIIEKYCADKRLPVRYRRDTKKLNSQDFWEPIIDHKKQIQHSIRISLIKLNRHGNLP